MSIEAMKQALEALQNITNYEGLAGAREMLRKAIEQAEKQEPVAIVRSVEGSGDKAVRIKWLGCFAQIGQRLYTSPQPRKPLTDEEIDSLCPAYEDPMRREMWKIGYKAAHNIKE